MTTRQVYGRGPLATSRSAIQKPQHDAVKLVWGRADTTARVRVVDSAAPGPAEEYELCLSRVDGVMVARIRHRLYSGHTLDEFEETEPAPEPQVRALWADVLAGRAR